MAEFHFQPDLDWSKEDATAQFHARTRLNSTRDSNQNLLDSIQYLDCVSGFSLLPDASIDLVVADPPFGLDFSGKESFYNRDPAHVVEGYHEVAPENYAAFSKAWISQLPRVLKNSGSAYIFSGWTNLLPILQAIEDAHLVIRNHIIWAYNFALFTKRKFSSSHYHILYVVKDEDQVFFNRIQHYETDLWEIPRKYRPNQKKNGTKLPIDLVRKCINYSSKPGDVVLDPFTGNATTQVAAKSEYRHYIGFEINENLQSLISKNIESMKTGELYIPYAERLPSVEELAEQYPKAYKEFQKSKKGN